MAGTTPQSSHKVTGAHHTDMHRYEILNINIPQQAACPLALVWGTSSHFVAISNSITCHVIPQDPSPSYMY